MPSARGVLAPLLAARWATAAAGPSKAERIEGAYFGALVADALCLGSHYEYSAPAIKAAYGGTIGGYKAPGEDMGGTTHGVGWGRQNYHPGQKRGDQTDYGEYTVLMLEYLANHETKPQSPPVNLQSLIEKVWLPKMTTPGAWGAWKCTQTKGALQAVARMSQSKAGLSSYRDAEISRATAGRSNAMSLRSAAGLGVYESEDDMALATRRMMFTHGSEEALAGGEFFARVAHKLVHQGVPASLEDLLLETAKVVSPWIEQQVRKGIDKFREATDASKPLSKQEFVDDLAVTSMARLWDVGKSEPIKVGKASPTEGVLPASVYIILKYRESFEDAVKANVMVGGDNASRSVAIGMVLGAYHGVGAIPADLRTGLNAWKKSEPWLARLSLLRSLKPGAAEL